MTFDETMQTLESLGTDQNRKTYARHGAAGPMFGVSFANLTKLKKSIKTDHTLAVQLWNTGNVDARTLATIIADPERMGERELDSWLDDVGYHMLVDLLAGNVVANLVAHLAMKERDLDDAFFERRIETIEEGIHGAKNPARYAMNSALIAIGMRNKKLEKRALAAAAHIGKVIVDHGETGCKTPDAASYIRKAAGRNKAVN